MNKLIVIFAIISLTLVGCGAKTAAPVAKETPAVQTPAVEKQWTQLATWTMTGQKNTESFKIEEDSEYRINWETFADKGSLALFLYDDKGANVGILANVKGISKDTSTIHAPAGNYYISQITEAGTKWMATIEKK